MYGDVDRGTSSGSHDRSVRGQRQAVARRYHFDLFSIAGDHGAHRASSRRRSQRLLAVLKEDRFFDIPALVQGNAPEPSDFGTAAYYKIAVMRCGAQRRDPKFLILFGAAPQPASNTTIFSIAIPLGTTPSTMYGNGIINLFDDVTHAIYQSQWTSSDIY
jgi:hypothetical protein